MLPLATISGVKKCTRDKKLHGENLAEKYGLEVRQKCAQKRKIWYKKDTKVVAFSWIFPVLG